MSDKAVQGPRWGRRVLLGGLGALAAAGAGGLGWLATREGGGLVPGVPRARPVESDTTLPTAVDVVVVGGGNVGCMTALTLAERGVRVALCEKGVVAGEASGRSLGYVDSQFLDPVKLPLINRSKVLWQGLSERVQADTGYRRTGLLTAFGDETGLASGQGWLDSVRGQPGVDARMLSAAEAKALVPQFSTPLAGGLYQASDGIAEPQWAAPALAAALRRHGGTLHQQCAVRGIERSAGKVSAVVTEKGRIACQAVVVAGGVWTPVLARSLGLDLPQFMAFSGIVRLQGGPGPAAAPAVIADLGFAMRASGIGQYDACVGVGTAPLTPSVLRHLTRLGPAMKNMWDQLEPVLDLGTFMADWRIPARWALDQPSPFEANRILMPQTRVAQLDEVRSHVGMVFPGLREARVVERWAGALMSTLDNMPVISGVDSVPGLYLGSGFYYGLTQGPAGGEALADLVMGRPPQFDLAPYRFSRFNDGSELVFRA